MTSTSTRWIGTLAVLAAMSAGTVQAQSMVRPAEASRATPTADTRTVVPDEPRAISFRQAITIESARQVQAASIALRQPAQPKQSGSARHNKLAAAIIAATIGIIVFVYVFTHTGS